jgi:hypothetical protein
MKTLKIGIITFLSILCFRIFSYSKAADDKDLIKPIQTMTGDELKVGDFFFKRTFSEHQANIILKYKGKILKTFDGFCDLGEEFGRKENTVFLYRLLGNKSIQAIVLMSAGGNEGGRTYSVIDLKDDGNIKELFDSDKYLSNGYFDVVDQNGSKLIEDDAVVNFSKVLSEAPIRDNDIDVIEIYYFNSKTHLFEPANDQFSNHLDSFIKLAKSHVRKNNLKSILSLTCIYWYSGRIGEGWKNFDKYYTEKDRDSKKSLIMNTLSEDPYFLAMNEKLSKESH